MFTNSFVKSKLGWRHAKTYCILYTYVGMCKALIHFYYFIIIIVYDKIIHNKVQVQVNKTKIGPELIVFHAFTIQGGPVDKTLN